MLTAYDKALTAAIMASLDFARRYWDVDLGISEETVNIIVPFISGGLVWLIPNKAA